MANCASRTSLKDIPYPAPTSPAASAAMRGNRRTDTKPEIAVRSGLHRKGYRFRKDLPIQIGEMRVRPDIVFPRQMVAIFIDGCFWHSCPEHGTVPQSNSEYWSVKLAHNVNRDRLVDEALKVSGWHPVRIWEHVSPWNAVIQVENALSISPVWGP